MLPCDVFERLQPLFALLAVNVLARLMQRLPHMSILFVVTLVLIALLMGTTFGHVLEMPSKLRANQDTWLTLQATLYRTFATIGGAIEIGAFLCACAVTYMLHGRNSQFWLSLSSSLAIGTAFFVIWIFMTNPVNRLTARWWREQTVPADWQRLRTQWEYSHALRFALHLFAFVTALLALVFHRVV